MKWITRFFKRIDLCSPPWRKHCWRNPPGDVSTAEKARRRFWRRRLQERWAEHMWAELYEPQIWCLSLWGIKIGLCTKMDLIGNLQVGAPQGFFFSFSNTLALSCVLHSWEAGRWWILNQQAYFIIQAALWVIMNDGTYRCKNSQYLPSRLYLLSRYNSNWPWISVEPLTVFGKSSVLENASICKFPHRKTVGNTPRTLP